MVKIYRITNYGNTRSVFVKGKSYEVSKNTPIEFTSEEHENAEEIANALGELEFVDVEIIEQPTAKQNKKKNVTTVKKNKKTKRRKK